MMRSVWFALTSLVISLPGVVAAGNITGNVQRLSDVHVRFFDALNAELLGTSVTGATGDYNSGLLPDGNYRVRFVLSEYRPEYFGAGGLDDFCSATVLAVSSSSSPVADESLVYVGPTPIAGDNISFRGTVTDADTLSLLAGIRVSFLYDENGEEVGTATTNDFGTFEVTLGIVGRGIKIRFSDPSGKYFPEYLGTPRVDDYCLGTTLNESSKGVTAALTLIPPATSSVDDVLQDLGLPGDVESTLTTPLIRATDALTDGNDSNDTASCGHLIAFISRVDIQERMGKLTTEEASVLRQEANIAMADLGCP